MCASSRGAAVNLKAAVAKPTAAAAYHKCTPVSEVVQEAVDGAGRQEAAGVQVCQHSGQIGTGQGLVLLACILQASSQSCCEVGTNASCIAGACQA